MKTVRKIVWALASTTLFLVALMVGCKDTNVGVIGKCPLVISTNPTSNAIGVPINQVVTVTFNEKMNPLTITPAAFSLAGGIPGGRSLGNISGSLTYDAATATMSFTPDSKLTLNTTYTGTVYATVKDLTGNALQANYIWSFSTVGSAPAVLSTDPINLATGVALNKVVSATFNTVMDPLTLTTSTFTLKQGVTPIAGAVSYTGTMASFTPTVALTGNLVYTATITTGAKNVAGIAMGSAYIWTFTTALAAAPFIILADPLNLATGVALNKVVKATFNMAMDPLTITAATFTLKQGVTPIAGTVAYAGSIASFTPTVPLVSNLVYTATVTTGAKNVAGIALGSAFVWTFTTLTVPVPLVTSTDPLDLATGVALNQVVTATFNMAMDPLTITALTFTLNQGVTPVAGAVTYLGTTASFTPTVPLASNLVYTATITTGAKNVAGTAMASSHVWTFTTLTVPPPFVNATDPLNLATGVALNKVISATFSEVMDPLTITSLTFTVSDGAGNIAGAINYSGSTATFTPAVNLLSGNVYTATITTGAKNPGGIALASNYVWTFSTVPPLGPAVVNLNTVARFGIIAGVGVSNNAGPSVINNLDVGIYPGARSSITGFPPATIVGGAMYASDDVAPPGVAAMLLQAQNDLTSAYNFAAAATVPAPAAAPADLGGKTLAPGIYTSATSMLLQNGDLTLDGQGDVNAVWIFQIGSTLTSIGSGPFPSAAGGNVILTGGAQAKNVFWQVGASATIGDYTHFQGTILAFSSITMNSGAVADGRMLARNAAVTMTSTNIINKP